MKAWMPTITAVGMFALWTTPAHSQAVNSGNKVIDGCRDLAEHDSPTSPYAAAFCAGYISGVLDSEMGLKTPEFCVPATATNLQIAKIVIKYMDNHPEQLHWRFDTIIRRSLALAFPCPKG